jgi:hypothetical protein
MFIEYMFYLVDFPQKVLVHILEKLSDIEYILFEIIFLS